MTGDKEGQCRMVSDFGEPLIVDWEAHQRGNLEEAMHDGVAIVAYDCHSLRLLNGCRIDSTYGFMAFSKKEEDVRFENADEVTANLPAFGLTLLKGLSGELTRDSTLDLAMILVGKKRTTVREAGRELLLGGTACNGATHFVRGAFVGAFAMGTGTKGGINLGAALFKAGSNSTKVSKYRDGESEKCEQVKSDSPSAPDNCDALVRLELVALGTSGSTGDTGLKQQTCSAGLFMSGGKCVPSADDKAHQCKPGDLADCTAQCGRQHAGSCVNLGFMYEDGEGVNKDKPKAAALYKQACDGADSGGCNELGAMYSDGSGVNKDEARAAALFKLACDGGSPYGCRNLGRDYEWARGVNGDFARAATLYKQACDGGSGQGCLGLSNLYYAGRGVNEDKARAVALDKQACDGGYAYGCVILGLHYAPTDVARAMALYKQACDAGETSGCYNLGSVYFIGQGVTKDYDKAEAFFEQSCDSKHEDGCQSLCSMANDYGFAPKDRPKAIALYRRGLHGRGCSAGNAPAVFQPGATADDLRAADQQMTIHMCCQGLERIGDAP